MQGQGLCPWNPTRGRCPLDSRQGRSPWNPSLGVVGREGGMPVPSSDRPLPVWHGTRSCPPPVQTTPNGWIAKALPLLGGPGGQSPPGGSRASPGLASFPRLPCLLTQAAPAVRSLRQFEPEETPMPGRVTQQLDPATIRLHRAGSGPALVMLHCLGMTHHLWDCLGGLADTYTLLSYDLPGHGETPVPAAPYGSRNWRRSLPACCGARASARRMSWASRSADWSRSASPRQSRR